MRTQKTSEQQTLAFLRRAATCQPWNREHALSMAAGALASVCLLSGETVGEAVTRLRIDTAAVQEMLKLYTGAGTRLRQFSRRS